jgi:lysophospholipase L1-like esterase
MKPGSNAGDRQFHPGEMIDMFFRLRIGRTLGITFFVVTLFGYRSFQNRSVLGLWSYPFVTVIVAAMAVWAAVVTHAWTRRQQYQVMSEAQRLTAKFWDLAVLCWGLAYLLEATADPPSAGKITDLIFFGSAMPAAALLEWASLLFMFGALVILIAPRLQGRWIGPGVAVGAVLAVLLVAEGILRLKVVVEPQIQGFPTFSGKAWGRRYEHVNRSGFRDVEHDRLAQPGTRRLLLIGDSFTWGSGIRHTEDRLGERLRNRLQAGTGQRWEIINAGIGDTHTLNHIATLDRMLIYRPDVVLLVYVFNDIDYLTQPPFGGDSPLLASLFGRLRPFWVFYNNSYLFQEVFVRLRKIYYEPLPDPYQNPTLLFRHLDDLHTFVEKAADTGAFVRIVPFDNAVTEDPGARARYETFVRGSEQRGLPVWSLIHVFDGYRIPDLTVNQMDGHPNETANRLMADEVARLLLHDLTDHESNGRVN